MKLFELGQRVPRRRDLREAALPYLQDLYESTHENIHLAVPDGAQTLFLEKVTGHRSTPVLSRVGAFVEIIPGVEGLLHISELQHGRTEKTEDVVKKGDHLKVKLLEVDERGRMRLSRKALIEKN